MNTTPPTMSGALWDVALECALRREYKDCDEQFDSDECTTCKYWIRRYAPDCGTAIDLLMVKAEQEACGFKLKSNGRKMFWAIVAIGFSLILLFMHIRRSWG